MREILFTVVLNSGGYEAQASQENITISGESWQLLKVNAELTVRSHFTGKGVPRVIRFRQEETLQIERPIVEHPWFERLSKADFATSKTDEQIRAVIEFFENWGYIDDLYPFWVTDPFECAMSKTNPSTYDNGDGFDYESYIEPNNPLLVYMDRVSYQS